MTRPFAAIVSPRAPLSEIDLAAWIGQAAPGDALEYHRGFLALDALAHASSLNEPRRRALRQVADRAHWAFEQRLVHLVQRRNGHGDFSYLAVVRLRPKAAEASLTALLLAEAA